MLPLPWQRPTVLPWQRPTELPVAHDEPLRSPALPRDLHLAVENDRPGVQLLAVLHHDRPGLLDDGKHHDGGQRAARRQSHVGKRLERRTKEGFYLATHSTHFIYSYMASDIKDHSDSERGRKEGNVLFNNTLNTFHLHLYGKERKCFI